MSTPQPTPVGHPHQFTWETHCTILNEFCVKTARPHRHGVMCDTTCRCRVDEKLWRPQ